MRVRSSLGRKLALGGTLAAIGGGLAVAGSAVAVAPDPPAGVTDGSLTISSSGAQNGQPIGPDASDPAVTSTIEVAADAQDVIRDVDLRTSISHTFPGDLDIELTSPGGTTVRLVVGPNAAADTAEAFDGTLWDDSADTLATDGPYPAAAVVPEGALGAFVGENPAGTWTLRVADTADLDAGTLESWELILTTQDAAPTAVASEHASSGDPVAIPDNTGVGATSQVTVSGAKGYLWDADLVTDVTHAFPSDLEIRLTNPAGRTVVISTGNDGGGATDFYADRRFDDSAPALVTTAAGPGNVVPEGALAPFIGSDPNGVWTLTVTDVASVDEGTLDGWSLSLQSTDPVAPPTGPGPGTPPPTPTPPPGVTISSADRCLPTTSSTSSPGRSGGGKVEVSVAQLRINQRIFQAAVRRANAVQTWLDAGVVGGDFCGGAIGATQLGPGITTGTLAQVQALTLPSPRPITVATAAAKPSAGFALSAGQFLINQRVAQAAVRRANGLQERLTGGLTGGDIRDGEITQDKLNGGLAIVSAQPVASPPAASTTVIGPGPASNAGAVRRTAAQILINQRIGQAAIRRLNALTARIESGLSASNLKDGSITAVDLAAGLRK